VEAVMRILVLFAAALALAGCGATAPKPKPSIALTEIPDDIRACARKRVPAPKGEGRLSEREAYRVTAALKNSEAEKSGCLDRVITLHDADAERLAAYLEALR
jgi:hypothetical protein